MARRLSACGSWHDGVQMENVQAIKTTLSPAKLKVAIVIGVAVIVAISLLDLYCVIDLDQLC